MPASFAEWYWQRQFASPTVQVSIELHLLATRDTEFPPVVGFALDLVGVGAPLFRRLVEPCAPHPGREAGAPDGGGRV